MGIDANNRRPLDKKLIAIFSFVRSKIIVQVTVLKTQAVKLADLPGEKRRVPHGSLTGALDHRSVIDEKSGRPILVQLKLGVAVSTIRAPPFRSIVSREPLAVSIQFRPPR